MRVDEIPSLLFLVAPKTSHSMPPEYRQRIDAIQMENLKRGRQTPQHIRFLTYTTRYNRSYWVTLDGLGQHYQRAEVDASRSDDRARYDITTKNVTRLLLRETDRATSITIDGQTLRPKPAAVLALKKTRDRWELARLKDSGLRKKHGLQGPIDDAFLEPFLVVRPTGTPWNAAANEQALRMLRRFERQYIMAYRGHLRIKDDKDTSAADFARQNVVLFGDPGSNRWIAKLGDKLPLRWTKTNITLGIRSFAAAESVPALIYPNPASPTHYVVLNSGLTADWADWAGDFPTPRWGDFAVFKVTDGSEDPDAAYTGLFDEAWKVPPAE